MHLLVGIFDFNSISAKAICSPPFRVKLDKRSRLIIGTHNEALTVPAMSVGDPDDFKEP
jgi:hypothetical protein